MKIYLVGGAVRDSLLKIPFHEKDYVVVGSSPEELSAKGFMPVGSQFPVFLHPETKEEYALARTERKSGIGHKGFVFHTDPSVTIEEDLIRRDLTINAIAKDDDGNLTDPYGGQQDIKNKLIKKVSDAFGEDPLRVYRVCRFAAKLKHLDFRIEENTLISMTEISHSGELETLPKERIWMETAKALDCKNPEVYFQTLKDCGALKKLLGDTDLNIQSLGSIATLTNDPIKRWAALLGKHKDLKKINDLFNAPKSFVEISDVFSKIISFYQVEKLTPKLIIDFIKKTDAIRREERFYEALEAFTLCNKILNPFDWNVLLNDLREVRPTLENKSGQEINKELENKKIKIIFEYMESK